MPPRGEIPKPSVTRTTFPGDVPPTRVAAPRSGMAATAAPAPTAGLGTASPTPRPLATLRTGLVLFVILTVLTGLIYPMLVTAIAQLIFPWQANGSLVNRRGQPVLQARAAIGSTLIGQYFSDPKYFWPRPSATAPVPYTAYHAATETCGTGSNWGPTNPLFGAAIRRRVARLRAADPGVKGPIPINLVTASASGLDPDISPAAALYQVPRVARARGLPVAEVRRLVKRFSHGRVLGLLGAPRVNVLKLNLALARLPR